MLFVVIAVIDSGHILLIKRTDFEVWCLPTGKVEQGESFAQAAIRETREETGLDVELTRLVGVYSILASKVTMHAILFTAKPLDGFLRTQDGETLAVRYFMPDKIPDELIVEHQRYIQDALHTHCGVAWLQKVNSPFANSATAKELYT